MQSTCKDQSSFYVITTSQSLLKVTCIELMMLYNCLILCCPLLLLPSICPSIRIVSNRLALHIMWPKRWNFCFSISPSNEYSELISFKIELTGLISLQSKFRSVQPCPTLCNPMDCSMPGFPVHHQLLELTQTHVHNVGDAIQPSHPLSSPSPPAFHLSQHQSLFKIVSSSHQVAKVLEFQLHHQSLQIILRTEFLYNGLVWSLCSSRDSQEFSSTPQFKSINSQHSAFFLVQLSHVYMTLGTTITLTTWTFVGKVMSLRFNTLCQPLLSCQGANVL